MERKKANALPTDLLWADLDDVNPDTIDQIPPPIVVQSSPSRWQAFWRLTIKLDPWDAERYSRRIAYSLKADKSGWDLTQVFRVPLTHNHKYTPPAVVMLERALTTKAQPLLFEALPKPPETDELPDLPQLRDIEQDVEQIISKHARFLDKTRFLALYGQEPEEDEDWSQILWHLLHVCYEAGMSPEEVFVVAKSAPCNKYARDGRPLEHLWRDVLKAGEKHSIVLVDQPPLLEMPKLVDEPADTETFIDQYKEWAVQATDAIVEFHELSAFILLSSICSSSVRLATSYGNIAPNLWGLVLGDSTVTRKTTSMRMAIELMATLDSDLILATDGSAEGLITGLATRPNKVSVFFRDEVSGLFDAINKRDYLAAMPEMLAQLYDVPPVFSRLLRKEVIRVESPAFIFYGGGIKDRVYSFISEEWIVSGFLPRFLIVAGEFDRESVRWTGPPTTANVLKRDNLVEKLANLYEHYGTEVLTRIGGQAIQLPPRVMADMTPDAWTRYQDVESKLTIAGYDSAIRDVALPTFDRMARSVMKMSMLLAAARQPPQNERIKIEESDVITSAWYAQKWGRHSVDLILNAGKSHREKDFDRVYRKIVASPGIPKSTLMQHLHLSKREADELIQTLEERGRIRKEQHGRGWRYWSL